MADSTTTVIAGLNTNETDCNIEDDANALFTALIADVPTPPTIDFNDDDFDYSPDDNSVLYEDPGSISIDDLTTGALDGTGVFDKMMASVDKHIQREFKDGRINADEYAKVYTQVMGGVLSNATQFVLTKDSARWAAIQAQMQARVAEVQATKALVELASTKVEAAKIVYDMQTSGAQYALTKVNVANAEAQHCLITAQTKKEEYMNEHVLPITLAQEQHKLNKTLPLQTQLIEEQVEKEYAQTMDTRTDGLTPVGGVIGQQKASLELDVQTKQYSLDNTLPAQLNILAEQRESERAKTLDTRTGGELVEGAMGKQKDLYDQQIDSFKKDAKYKTAKMYLDGWITQKTLDEGLTAPDQLTNTNIDSVLSAIRLENSL